MPKRTATEIGWDSFKHNFLLVFRTVFLLLKVCEVNLMCSFGKRLHLSIKRQHRILHL